jgi:hypothetical protein
MPIYFGYPKQEKYQITINIPEGYWSNLFLSRLKLQR